jgi:malate synthase
MGQWATGLLSDRLTEPLADWVTEFLAPTDSEGGRGGVCTAQPFLSHLRQLEMEATHVVGGAQGGASLQQAPWHARGVFGAFLDSCGYHRKLGAKVGNRSTGAWACGKGLAATGNEHMHESNSPKRTSLLQLHKMESKECPNMPCELGTMVPGVVHEDE